MKRLMFVAVVAVLFACSSSDIPEPLPEGKCYTNEDCRPGERCAAGICEDIYHPDVS